jgi:hypothetical protein
MCGVGQKKTTQAGQRGTCQHSRAATQIRASRARNKHHIAGSKPIAHQLQNQDGSRCMCGVGQKKTKQAGQRGTCQHSRPSTHIWATRAHNIHHIAGSKPITHQLQNQDGSRCMCGVGRKKTKQASQRGTCQHSQPAISTHLGNEGTYHTPHGGQQADHSHAAESGWIQMHVWGRAKE